ncbi:MAG: hypothetical protein ACP5PW_03590 [Candidatus Dormibacteria bacterium]
MPNHAPSEDSGPDLGGKGTPPPVCGDGFSRLAAHFAGRAETDLPAPGGRRGRFGADALRVRGRIFALESHGQLVVRLPKARARELILQGTGVQFTAGRGVPMRGWVALAAPGPGLQVSLAEEAFTHVQSLGPR